MESVTQQHGMACGLACVSYVAMVPYEELVKVVSDEQLNTRGFYCPELVKILNDAGLNYSWKKLSETERDDVFAIGDIVFVEPSTELPYGHFLAKAPDGWMDPWINLTESNDVSRAKSGFRPHLPGRAEYLIHLTT